MDEYISGIRQILCVWLSFLFVLFFYIYSFSASRKFKLSLMQRQLRLFADQPAGLFVSLFDGGNVTDY